MHAYGRGERLAAAAAGLLLFLACSSPHDDGVDGSGGGSGAGGDDRPSRTAGGDAREPSDDDNGNGGSSDSGGETRVITPPDAEGARGGFTDLPPFEGVERTSRCVRPLLIGHRGSRFAAPENTLPAFGQAIEAGGDGVEIDVRPTADGELVAFHDSRTAATTDDATDRLVSDVTLAELQALDAGSWFAAEWAGTRVPTVREVVEALPSDTVLVFDVKSGGAAPLVELIAELGIAERSIAAASNVDRLQVIRDAFPDMPLAYFASDTGELSVAEPLEASYVRVPVSQQHLEAEHWAVVDAGYEPIVSSTYLTWNVGMVFVNNMVNGVARRDERMPAACATGE